MGYRLSERAFSSEDGIRVQRVAITCQIRELLDIVLGNRS
jgi:hypothetical protein